MRHTHDCAVLTHGLRFGVACVLGIAWGCRGLAAPAAATKTDAAGLFGIPAAWEERVVFYDGFERHDGQPEFNPAGLRARMPPRSGPGGILGCAGMPTEDHRTLVLSGPILSPHRPVAVSFWWSVREPVKVSSGFGLWHLGGGRGMCSLFARGGPWCGLRDTAGVFQVYYLPGIHNVNGIFDRHVRRTLELEPGAWHHAAVVFTAGSRAEVYVDGRRVFETRLRGRAFTVEDGLTRMEFGSAGGVPVALDEVMVLNRPLTAVEIDEYVIGVRQMHTAGVRGE